MNDDRDIQSRLAHLLTRMEEACRRSGRQAGEISLVAAAKKQDPDRINILFEALRERGLTAVVGENYVQEFLKKQPHLKPPFHSHLIGPLQSNKVREAVAAFDLIQSVHSEKILRLISKEASLILKNQEIFLQVNISEDPAKSGVRAEELSYMYGVARKLPNVTLKGIMTISAFYENREDVRKDYRACTLLARNLEKEWGGKLEISMGMSDDFDIAIEEGATMVRIGSALFGNRN